jgi:hypothetical protein
LPYSLRIDQFTARKAFSENGEVENLPGRTKLGVPESGRVSDPVGRSGIGIGAFTELIDNLVHSHVLLGTACQMQI